MHSPMPCASARVIHRHFHLLGLGENVAMPAMPQMKPELGREDRRKLRGKKRILPSNQGESNRIRTDAKRARTVTTPFSRQA
jgi:hypothetical protein